MINFKIRKAKINDVEQLHKLINYFARKELLLPRSLNEIYENLRDFWVAEKDNKIVACLALHITWEELAEIRSFCVKNKMQNKGIGKKLMEKAIEEAKFLGAKKIFVLTYLPEYFTQFGFMPIAKSKLPQKIWQECIHCPKFPDCEEEALIRKL